MVVFSFQELLQKKTKISSIWQWYLQLFCKYTLYAESKDHVLLFRILCLKNSTNVSDEIESSIFIKY